MKTLPVLLAALAVASCSSMDPAGPRRASAPHEPSGEASGLELGAFSVSLAVQDLAASRAFYEKLGFQEVGATRPAAG